MFTKYDFHWRLYGNSETSKVVEILNTLTPEQEKAVRLYGDSQWNEGDDNGFENGCNEGSHTD